MMWRGRVTSVTGPVGYVYVEIERRARGHQFRCQLVHPPPHAAAGSDAHTHPPAVLAAGDMVLVAEVGGNPDDLVVVGRLLP